MCEVQEFGMHSIDGRTEELKLVSHTDPSRHKGATKIRTMIVGRQSSELPALHSIISEINTLDIVAAADSVSSAVTFLKDCRPELIVLDSRIPVESALEILERTQESARTVFGSILLGVGFRFFELREHASPLDSPETEEVLLQGSLQANRRRTNERKLTFDDPIILKLSDQYHVVRVRSILSVSAARHYTFVVTVEGYKGLASKSMKDWEDRLPGNLFVRIHRNTIINLEYIEHIDESVHSPCQVYLKGVEKPISMSTRCFSRIKRQLN